MHTHRRTVVAYTVQWSEDKLVALCAVELVCSEAFCTQGLRLFLVTLLSYSVPKCSATARRVLSGLIPLKHWAVYILSRLFFVFFPSFFFIYWIFLRLISIDSHLLLFRGRSMGYLKVCVKEEEIKRVGWWEGKRGGESNAFPGQLTYHCAQFLRPVGDAHAEGRGHTCWRHLCCGGNFALWHLAPSIASLIN